jgi:hypothetical protein
MRCLAAATWVLLLVSPGCGDCWSSGITPDFRLTATLQGQLADGRTFDTQYTDLEAPNPSASVQFGMPAAYHSRPIAFPQEMIVTMPLVVRLSDGASDRLSLQLTVREVPSGPSEIDLDDARALVDGWSNVRGHLGITKLSQDCSNGSQNCVIEMHGELSLSATNAAGDTFSMTGATFDLQETYYRVQITCAQIGE